MGEANIESYLELIEGEIFEMAPIGFNHARHVTRLINFFVSLLHGKTIATAQHPLQLSELSEPEFDFILLRPDTDDYTTHYRLLYPHD